MQQQQSHPKRQHWIPECYLKRWAVHAQDGDKPGIWRIDRATRQSRLLSLDNVCVEGHIYTREGSDGRPDYGAEELLGQIEYGFDQVMRDIVEPLDPLCDDSCAALAW